MSAELAGQKTILDPCCGGRMFWFNKKNPRVLYCDMRREIFNYPGENGRTLKINPDILCDFTDLPFADETFWHVVFDPPHYTKNGKGSRMAGIYGTLPKEWKPLISKGFSECWRVLRENGTLIFKWCADEITVNEIISVIGREPLYGHPSGKAAKTHWLSFMKFEADEKLNAKGVVSMLKEKHVKCLELLREGKLTQRQIAAKLNVTEQTICNWKKKPEFGEFRKC